MTINISKKVKIVLKIYHVWKILLSMFGEHFISRQSFVLGSVVPSPISLITLIDRIYLVKYLLSAD